MRSESFPSPGRGREERRGPPFPTRSSSCRLWPASVGPATLRLASSHRTGDQTERERLRKSHRDIRLTGYGTSCRHFSFKRIDTWALFRNLNKRNTLTLFQLERHLGGDCQNKLFFKNSASGFSYLCLSFPPRAQSTDIECLHILHIGSTDGMIQARAQPCGRAHDENVLACETTRVESSAFPIRAQNYELSKVLCIYRDLRASTHQRSLRVISTRPLIDV